MTIGNGTEISYPVESYTAKEVERIEEFRVKVEGLELSGNQLDDAHLIRWLRARSLDVEKAYEMLKQSLEWRRENKIDGILEREDVPKDIQRRTPFAKLGLDKDGYPILLVPMGRHDARTMLEKYGAENCFRYNTINCEKVMQMLQNLSEEQGRQVTQFVEIIDLEGYNYRQLTSKLCRDFMVRMQTTFDANYPELLRYCIVVNAPKVFHILFNMLKPFIPKQTLEKVDIYGPEPEKWKKVIAEKFPVELIPPHWGGTRPGSDEFCSQNDIWLQGPVPYNFFTENGSLSIEDSEDGNLISATINPRDSLKIAVNVTKYKCSIAWKFRSNNHDIGFQIVYQNGNAVVPFSRIQSQKQIHEGNYSCDKLGTYTVIFDNSYSLARSKTVSYSVSVIDPEEENSNYEKSSAVDSSLSIPASTKNNVMSSSSVAVA